MYPTRVSASEGRHDTTASEEAGDQLNKPVWQPSTPDSLEDESVIYAIKGFGGIHKEDVEIGGRSFFNGIIKGLVQFPYVILEVTIPQKPFLAGVEGGLEGWGDSFDYRLGYYAIVRVSDRDRARVAWEKRTRFGKEEEETIIKAFRRENPGREVLYD